MKKYLLLIFAVVFVFTGCSSKDSMFKKGVVYAKSGKRDAALNMYNKVLKKDPDYFSALVNRAIIFEQMGDDTRAEKDYKRAYKVNRQNSTLLTNMGAFYFKKKYPLDALFYLNAAIESDYKNVSALLTRAAVYESLGYKNRAMEDILEAQAVAPDSQLVTVAKAKLDAELYRFEDALKGFTEAIYNDPKNAEYYYLRGNVFIVTRHYANALSDYDMAVSLKKDHIPALYAKAQLLFKSGDYESALADLNKIKSINNKYVKAYEFSGDILAIEDPVSATSNYMAARKLDPKNAKRYNAKIKLMKTDAGRRKVIKRTFDDI